MDMPENMAWPRFEDGELAEFGDRYVNANGNEAVISKISFAKGCAVVGRGPGKVVLEGGKRLKRPPDALELEGEPLKAGDTVYLTRDACMKVSREPVRNYSDNLPVSWDMKKSPQAFLDDPLTVTRAALEYGGAYAHFEGGGYCPVEFLSREAPRGIPASVGEGTVGVGGIVMKGHDLFRVLAVHPMRGADASVEVEGRCGRKSAFRSSELRMATDGDVLGVGRRYLQCGDGRDFWLCDGEDCVDCKRFRGSAPYDYMYVDPWSREKVDPKPLYAVCTAKAWMLIAEREWEEKNFGPIF